MSCFLEIVNTNLEAFFSQEIKYPQKANFKRIVYLAYLANSGFAIVPASIRKLQDGLVSRFIRLTILLAILTPGGCNVVGRPATIPSEKEVIRDQLIIHSDFQLPRKHRIVNELVARRGDISSQLNVPTSDEPIHVYLFSDEKTFRKFMKQKFPAFPHRRAFFVKSDTTLMVYAYWGSRVAEDLRHEVTHGYLHSVVPNVPLWMDEGIAEYFEVARGSDGINHPHVSLLAQSFRDGSWRPDLMRLENLPPTSEMSQLDYAESWLWVHFLLNSDAQTNTLICEALAETRKSGKATTMSQKLSAYLPDSDVQLVSHLKSLADGL